MGSMKLVAAGVAAALIASYAKVPVAFADEGFPFGMEMTLDALPQPGSKRIPDLWCKGGKGQFSVAGSSIVFIAGPMQERSCAPDRAQADDELLAALSATTNWKRQGDAIVLVGPKTLRFHLNTN